MEVVQDKVGPDRLNGAKDRVFHGEFEIGGQYRLRRGAYVSRASDDKTPAKLVAPDRFGTSALGMARARFHDFRQAPVGYSLPEAEDKKAEPLLPVEDRHAGDRLPEWISGTCESGTQFRLRRVVEVTKNLHVLWIYEADVLDGPLKGRSIDLAGVSDEGMDTFQHLPVPGRERGYSLNPLMIERVAD